MSKEVLSAQLDEGLSYLSKEERQVLLLKYYEDLTEVEIQYAMSITPEQYFKFLGNALTIMKVYTSIFEDLNSINLRKDSMYK